MRWTLLNEQANHSTKSFFWLVVMVLGLRVKCRCNHCHQTVLMRRCTWYFDIDVLCAPAQRQTGCAVSKLCGRWRWHYLLVLVFCNAGQILMFINFGIRFLCWRYTTQKGCMFDVTELTVASLHGISHLESDTAYHAELHLPKVSCTSFRHC